MIAPPDPAAMAEVDDAFEHDRAGEEPPQFLDPREALDYIDEQVREKLPPLVVCDACRQIVTNEPDAKAEFVTPCPNCGGETATYPPFCEEGGCKKFAYALMPGIGSRCKPHWRKLKRVAEAPKRPGAAGRKHGRNKKRRKGRR